jgi:hypothetical protein
MKKYFYLTVLSGMVLGSCNKQDATTKPAAESKDAPYVKKGGQEPQPQAPMRKYYSGADECADQPQNCAPEDLYVQGYPPNSWFIDFINWLTKDPERDYSCGSVDIRWSSNDPSAPVFRTSEYDNLLLASFSNLGIKTQAQLNDLDNETFYKTLLPDLSDAQRSMLYARNYKTMVGRGKNGKGFIFVAPKDKATLQDAYTHLVLVIPITLGARK